MTDKKLIDFYNLIAFGEFNKALEMDEGSAVIGDDRERIAVEALKLKKILQNSGCLSNV